MLRFHMYLKDGTFLWKIRCASNQYLPPSPSTNTNREHGRNEYFLNRKCSPLCTCSVPPSTIHTIRQPVQLSTHPCLSRVDWTLSSRDIVPGLKPCLTIFRISEYGRSAGMPLSRFWRAYISATAGPIDDPSSLVGSHIQ